MYDEEHRVFLVDIRHGVHGTHQIRILRRGTSEENGLWRFSVLICLATLHAAHVYGAEPVYHGVYAAALLGVLSEVPLYIHLHLSKPTSLHTVGGSCQ